jgi:hypothetical protein
MKGKYKRKEKRKDTPVGGNSPTVNPGVKQEHSREEEHETKGNKRKDNMDTLAKWWRDPAHVIQSIGVGIGTLVALIYAGQLCQMIESNRINNQSLVAVQRAFIGLPTISERRKIIDGNTKRVAGIQFKLAWTNSGNTQTKNLTICPSREDVSAGYTNDLPDKCGKPFQAVAAPKDTVLSPTEVLLPALLDNLRDGKTKVTIWGWVKYRDVFPNTVEHITRYCTELAGVLGYDNPDPNAPFEFQVSGCSNTYSCSDEECSASH